MPQFRVLQPFCYISGNMVIEITKIGSIVNLDQDVADPLVSTGAILYTGSDFPLPPPTVTTVLYDTSARFPYTGSVYHLYLAQDTGKLYRWTGSAYAEI